MRRPVKNRGRAAKKFSHERNRTRALNTMKPPRGGWAL